MTLVGSVVNTVSEYIPRRISVKTLVLLVSRVGGEVLRTKSQTLEPVRGDILARAILRRPGILILDEALNSMEEWREKKILEKLREYLRESLIVIVSHRSSVLSLADEIYVIEDGVLKRVKA